MEEQNPGKYQEEQSRLKLVTFNADDMAKLREFYNTIPNEVREEQEEVPDFVKGLKSRICFMQGFEEAQQTKHKWQIAIGEDFYVLASGHSSLQIFDLESKKLRRVLKFEEVRRREPGSNNLIQSVTVVKNRIYCYFIDGTIYYNREGERILTKVKWLSKQLELFPGLCKCLKAGFKGGGLVSGTEKAVSIIHLNHRGDFRYRTNFRGFRRKLQRFNEFKVINQVVAGRHQNIVVTQTSKYILTHLYSFINRKILKRAVYVIPDLSLQPLHRTREEAPQMMDCIQCDDGSRYILFLYLDMRRTGWWELEKMSSGLVVLKLTTWGSLEEVARCDLREKDIGPIHMLKFFGDTYEGGRYLMLGGVVGSPDRSRKVTFFVFDQVGRTISVVRSLDLWVNYGEIYVGERMFGGVYCVNEKGFLIGIELQKET